MCKKKGNSLKVRALPKEFVEKTLEYENYALIYSKNYELIMNGKETDSIADKDGDQSYWEGLVKITNPNKKCKYVYRKCRAFNEIKCDEIALGYRTKQVLGIKQDDEKVKIQRACWFCYLWCHGDSAIKHSFRLAVLGLLATIVFSLISLLMNYFCCC